MTKCRKSTTGLLVVAMVTGAALLSRAWLSARADALATKPGLAAPATVRVVTLRPEVVASSLSYSAGVKEIEHADLSFRVGGTVEALHQVMGPDGKLHSLHEGDRVPKGTVLARLDPADYRREHAVAVEKLATAEAKLAQAESESSLAQQEFHRAEQLLKRKAGTVAELDTARAKLLSTAAGVAGARRDVESSRINLDQAAANLSYCTLSSPFDEGTIAARYVDAGVRVAANQRAFQVVDLSSVVIAFGVPDTVVGRLHLGQEVEVVCDALPGERFKAVVHKIGTIADPQSRTYAVEVRVDEPKGLRPGMVSTVRFRRETEATLLPLTAILPRPSSRAHEVYRVVEEDSGRQTVERVPVELVDVLDNRIAVKADESSVLKPGDHVVATGTHRLYDGQAVHTEE
jgi:RND family efflux transporter MFP subunit